MTKTSTSAATGASHPTASATTAVVLPVPPVPKNILPERTADTGTSVVLLLLTLAFLLWASRALRRARERLPNNGLIPRASGWAQLLVRASAILIALELLLRLLPESMSPAIPWAIVAAAAAVGWSSRDLLPDVIAGLVLEVERKVRPGDWIASEGLAGTVQSIGFRASTIRDARGQILTVPNRHLVGRTVAADASPWPEIEVLFAVPERISPRDAERTIREAALLLPWLAPAPLTVVRGEGGYRLRVRVLEGRFIDDFSTAVRDRVDEALRQVPL